MGYYTHYAIESPTGETLKNVVEEINHVADGCVFFYEDGNTADHTYKWYDHEEDLAHVSLTFKDVLITVVGKGEEPGDLWVKYFRNGKMQKEKAVITYPPCKI